MLRTQQNIEIKDPSVRKPRFKFWLTNYQLCDLQILFILSEPQHPHQQSRDKSWGYCEDNSTLYLYIDSFQKYL